MALLNPRLWVALVGMLHFALMAGELFPPKGAPVIMERVLSHKGMPLELSAEFPGVPHDKCRELAQRERDLIATVVRNTAIYNGIVGAALLAAAFVGRPAFLIQVVILLGVIVAGMVGGLTLSEWTYLQAVAGAVALAFVLFSRPIEGPPGWRD